MPSLLLLLLLAQDRPARILGTDRRRSRHSRGYHDTKISLIGLNVTGSLTLVCFASLAFAQGTNTRPYPRIEVFGGYSSIETNDHSFQFADVGPVSHLDFDEGGRGFEAAAIGNLSRWVGIVGDISAYFSMNQFPVQVSTACSQPPCLASTQPGSINPRLFNFLGGPEAKWRNQTRFTPFVQTLIGAAHSTATFNTTGSALNLSRTDAETGFAMRFGGGLDVRMTRRFSLRTLVMYSQAFVGSNALPRQRVDALGWSSGLLFH
jgi:hypothetical protein